MSRFFKKLLSRKAALLGIGLLFFAFLLFFVVPFLIEQKIASNLELEEVRQELGASQVPGGYRLSTQGIRFDIQKGIVLNGIRLYQDAGTGKQTEKKLLFRAESMVLEYSLWRALRSLPPVTAIHFQKGEWMPQLGRNSNFFPIFSFLFSLPKFSGAPLFSDAPKLYLEGIRLNFLQAKKPVWQSFMLSLEAQREAGGLLFRFQLHPKNSSAQLRGRGRWSNSQTGVVHFQIHQFSIGHFLELLKHIPTLASQNANQWPGFAWESGQISGKGSIQFYEKSGVGFDIKAAVRDPKAAISYGKNRAISLHPKRLELHYNAGWHKGKGYSFIELALKNSDLQFSVSFRDSPPLEKKVKKKAPLPARLQIQGKFNLSAKTGLEIPGIESAKGIRFRFLWEIFGEQFQSRGLDFLAENLRLKNPFPKKKPFVISSLSFRLPAKPPITETHPARLVVSARRGQAKLNLQGKGNLFIKKTRTSIPPVFFRQDWKIALHLKNWSYLEVAEDVLAFHKILIEKGSQKDAPRAEDHGPLWKQKFQATPVYVGLVEGFKMDMQGEAKEMQDAGGLPKKFSFRASFRNGQGELRFDPPECYPQCDLRLSYKLALNRNIPRHDIDFYIRNTSNKSAFAFLTGSSKPPQSYSFRYLMGGDGWLPGDLVHRSFSRAELEAAGLWLAKPRLLKLLNYGAGETGRAFSLDELKLKYGSDGPRSSVFVRARHGTKVLSAKIMRRLGEAGRGSVSFENGPALSKRQVHLHFFPNGSWRPEL